jgi:acyl transferase domain-containing protein/NADP-dependent 3-hydroxy acid dehydrogenase YdfG
MSLFNREETSGLEIAIIGMSGRFPNANTPCELWANLRNGVEGITFFSDEELELLDDADLRNPDFVKAGGVIGDAAHFDAELFGINPREAELMDPQHRILLECAWTALEDAGYAPEMCPVATGVYAGAGANRYVFLNILGNDALVQSVGMYQIALANQNDYLSTQVSYRLGLCGPSMTVQTACSTSLVAIHQACQGLISGEADMAIAGGVSIQMPEKVGYMYQEGMINSPDGHCRPFDAKASGTLRGNGAGVVVLKRLGDAVSARDNILAIIKGSAVNNDGARKNYFTSPSVDGQMRVIMAAHAVAEVAPDTIQYIEAHGTGTNVGDPIEIKALTEAFRRGGDRRRSACAVGALKSNVGHMDSAAGVGGLIKAVLSLKHEEIPAVLHFEKPNPHMGIEDSPFYINENLRPWPKGQLPRRAGVSSFGNGGTNAHIVVEEAPDPETSDPGREWKVLVLSAKSDAALAKVTSNLAGHLRAHPEINIADVAFTLAVGRKGQRFRSAVVARDREGLCEALEHVEVQRGEVTLGGVNIVFMFPGQGAEYQAMGRQLYDLLPEFRRIVDECSDHLRPRLRNQIRTVIRGDVAELEPQPTMVMAPALFIVEYSLAHLWLSWGIRPASMIGQGIGEYVAACLAGVMTMEEALGLVCMQAELLQSVPQREILQLEMSAQEVDTLLPPSADISWISGAQSCVVSGPEDAITSLEEELRRLDHPCIRIKMSHALHAGMTDPVLEVYEQAVTTVKLLPPQVPLISSATGTWITPVQAQSPTYWVQQSGQAFCFGDGMATLLKRPGTVFVEVGPGTTLSQLLDASQSKEFGKGLLEAIGGISPTNEYAGMLDGVRRLWARGAAIDWSAFYQTEQRARVSLPTYPFERQKYYLEPTWGKRASRSDTARSPLADWFYLPSWKRSLPPSTNLAARDSPNTGKTCILFTDRESVGTDFGQRLESRDWQVVWIYAGSEYTRIDSTHFAMRPGSEADWLQLAEELKGIRAERIGHFWNASGRYFEGPFEARLDRSFFSLLYLARCIAASSTKTGLGILIASCNLHAIDGDDIIDPWIAPLLGPCRIIPQEFDGLRCSSVDIPNTVKVTSDRERVLEDLLCEFHDLSERVVAYRGTHRWTQSWENTALEETRPNQSLREGGVYLITGGLGGIGLSLAEYLSSTGKRPHLLLLGRSAFPPRDQWNTWLMEHAADDEVAQKIRRIEKIEANGAAVQVLVADVSAESDMVRVRDQIGELYGKVDGIVHAAGVAGGGLLQLRSREAANRVMAPKINGTLLLHQLFPEVDFLVLCSSITAALGGVGQADYCAANCFMDAFAVASNVKSRGQILSIGWDAWQEVGMSIFTEVPRDWEANREKDLQTAINPSEGVRVFGSLLGTGAPRMLVSTRNFSQRVREAEASRLPQARDTRVADAIYERPRSLGPYEPPVGNLERMFVAVWSELLAISPIGRNDDFFELGGHSLLAIQLISRMRDVLQVDVPMDIIFEYSTPAAFCEQLRSLESQQGEMEQIAQIVNSIDEMSDSEIAQALEQGSMGAFHNE